jgi:glycerol uptake facilitator-like aquaporin
VKRRHALIIFFFFLRTIYNLSVTFGWAVGLALGAWVSGGISGGHINPAVWWNFFG